MTKKIVLLFLILSLFGLPQLSKAVTVGPVKLEYSANPGDLIKGEMFLQNEEKETKTFYPSFEKFTEDNGEKKFILEESDLPAWFKMPASINLISQEQKKIPFEIQVPSNASPGGHYAVMWWSSSPPKNQRTQNEQVSIVTRAGILVYLRVSGDIKESGEVLEFSAKDKYIFNGLPASFSLVFKNNGNVHLKPQGYLTIKNIFGKEKAKIKINEIGLNILPQSKRSFNIEWNDKGFFFGPYKAELDLIYGENQTKISKNLSIWVIPVKAIVVFVAILLAIFIVIPQLIKRYNRWIINKASKN